jgi:hypothetical protein
MSRHEVAKLLGRARGSSIAAKNVAACSAVNWIAVLEGVEALPQCLAVHGDVPLARRSRLLVKDGGMAAERLLDRSGVELPENVSDGRIGWRPEPKRAPLAVAGLAPCRT